MKFELRQIHQQFGETTALQDINLTLEGDKIIGLLGRNGSGKTTLLSILAGFRRPTSGDVLLDGEPVFENLAITQRIALIREGGDTVEASEKVSEAMRYAEWLRPNWDADMAGRLLDRFEVPTNRKLQDLSRGKRTAVGIALGLAARTDVTMFDETYLGLDAPARYAFYEEVLQNYMDHPRMFILSTHLIDEVARILEEIVIIDSGQLLLQDSAEQLTTNGVSVTGDSADVAAFVAGRKVIGDRSLGRTRSAMIYGTFDASDREHARAASLELAPIELQDLFVHLTTPQGAPK